MCACQKHGNSKAALSSATRSGASRRNSQPRDNADWAERDSVIVERGAAGKLSPRGIVLSKFPRYRGLSVYPRRTYLEGCDSPRRFKRSRKRRCNGVGVLGLKATKYHRGWLRSLLSQVSVGASA